MAYSRLYSALLSSPPTIWRCKHILNLRRAFGDVECDDVVHVARLHCRNCDGKGSLELKLGGPPGDMADVVIQRRIDRIVYIRRIVWKDKRGV